MEAKKSVLVICCAVALCTCVPCAQAGRESLKTAPSVAYSEMLKLSQAKDFGKIPAYLAELRPVSAGIQSRFGIDMEKEITASLSKSDQAEVSDRVFRMVFLDMKDIFSTILESKNDAKDSLKGMLKTAMLDYSVFTQKITQDSFSDHTRILSAFKRSNELIDAPTVDAAQLSVSFRQIEAGCQNIIPDLKNVHSRK